jgi:PLP dependent protein
VPPAGEPGTAGRRAELADNLAAVRSRIAVACAAAGRPADAVTLVAVTKTFPASDVALLAGLGITQVGENYDAEAAAKAAASADLSLTWHFIGQVQTRKAASVAAYADVVHSVDRPRLITALGRRAAAAGRELLCLVQVSLDEPDPAGAGHGARGGAPPGQVAELADAIAAEPGLALGGVMALAPPDGPARPAFAQLREISALVTAAHPAATMISAGMSADMSDAIAEGATLVRIGTALLGGRRAFVR